MVSRGSDSAATKSRGEESNEGLRNLSCKIDQLITQIQAERAVSIEEKLEKNREKLESHVSQLISTTSRNNGFGTLLSSRIENPVYKFSGFEQGMDDKDCVNSHEVVFSTSTKLPVIEKIPPYTTWIFLERNQRMPEDQPMVGRRRIYYDQHGSEALVCSDSEEDVVEHEEEKHEFSECEDRILRMVFEEHKEHDLSEEVMSILRQFIGGATLEIQERYNAMKEKDRGKDDRNIQGSGEFWPESGISLDKTLCAALDSFDSLFCRRCVQFDCRLHGCSQSLIFPIEKQPYCSEYEDDGKPCSDQCYLHLRVVKNLPEDLQRMRSVTLEQKERNLVGFAAEEPKADDSTDIVEEERSIFEKTMPVTLEALCNTELPAGGLNSDTANMKIHYHESMGKRNILMHKALCDPTLSADDLQGISCKKQKKLSTLDAVTGDTIDMPVLGGIFGAETINLDTSVSSEIELQMATKNALYDSIEDTGKKIYYPGGGPCDETRDDIRIEAKYIEEVPEFKQSSSGQVEGVLSGSEWKPIEKELYLKGIEIFGRNSCLIARNLLSGLKTCSEVFKYMSDRRFSVPHRSVDAPSSLLEDKGKADTKNMEPETTTRTQLLRRKGRTRKLKYSLKSSGHPSIWKRIANGKNQSCKQYTPCGCQSICGKQCPCLQNGTCCEKYCGCSKSCKNRFRGCHCAKSQCRSRQCPCFAANRECDPDVCRNCWVGCGDGSLGEPPRRGDCQCGNMKLLLRQQQRILLGKSNIAGWGAFLKNPVNKNDYLGEYTGELISHHEADKRGKIYDRVNSSFLFDLNDQYVLDAYCKGDKLKFANHSSKPNCHAKVMLVQGDHRVGIFANEHIEAGEELFYDYCYGPDQAPIWARKPEGSKKDDSSVSRGRAKKHQSH